MSGENIAKGEASFDNILNNAPPRETTTTTRTMTTTTTPPTGDVLPVVLLPGAIDSDETSRENGDGNFSSSNDGRRPRLSSFGSRGFAIPDELIVNEERDDIDVNLESTQKVSHSRRGSLVRPTTPPNPPPSSVADPPPPRKKKLTKVGSQKRRALLDELRSEGRSGSSRSISPNPSSSPSPKNSPLASSNKRKMLAESNVQNAMIQISQMSSFFRRSSRSSVDNSDDSQGHTLDSGLTSPLDSLLLKKSSIKNLTEEEALKVMKDEVRVCEERSDELKRREYWISMYMPDTSKCNVAATKF